MAMLNSQRVSGKFLAQGWSSPDGYYQRIQRIGSNHLKKNMSYICIYIYIQCIYLFTCLFIYISIYIYIKDNPICFTLKTPSNPNMVHAALGLQGGFILWLRTAQVRQAQRRVPCGGFLGVPGFPNISGWFHGKYLVYGKQKSCSG